MCNLYSITTNQAASAALFRVIGVFPDYLAPVVRNTDTGTEMVTMRLGHEAAAHGRLVLEENWCQ